VLEIGNHTATSYLGKYEDYLYKKKIEQEALESASIEKPAAGSSDEAQNSASDLQEHAKKKRTNPIKIRQLNEKIEEVESKIHLHETRIAVLAQMLSSEELYRDYQLFRATMEDHDKLREELAHFMEEWEKLQTELAELAG